MLKVRVRCSDHNLSITVPETVVMRLLYRPYICPYSSSPILSL